MNLKQVGGDINFLQYGGILVLLSKLLKDTKNLYKDVEGKELLVYKYKTQRRMIETLFDESVIDKYIDKLKDGLYKESIKKQAEKKLDGAEDEF
jgi:hypothetical protein